MPTTTPIDRPEWGDVQIAELLDKAKTRLTAPRIGKMTIRETDHDLITIRNLTEALTHTRAALTAATGAEEPSGHESLDWALHYARRYWQHGQEPQSQRALTILALAVARRPAPIEAGERVALALAIYRARELDLDYPASDDPITLRMADAILAAGFRRAPMEDAERCLSCGAKPGEVIEPISPADGRIGAWHRLAEHPAFADARHSERPMIDAVLDRLSELVEMESTVHELKPAEDAEPVAYEVRDRRGMKLSIVRPGVVGNYEPEFYTLTPLYRHPSAPIEVTDEMVERAAEALFEEMQELDQENSWDDPLPDEWRDAWRDAARECVAAALSEMEKNR